MKHNALVGKCGLYCGACRIYRIERDSMQMCGEHAKECGCTPEQVSCNGCGALTEECWGNGCKIVKCTSAKGYDYCYQCDEYRNESCEKYGRLYSKYMNNCKVDLRENLGMIEAGKAGEWLAESEKRFSCPQCGKPVIAGADSCHHCSSRLVYKE